MTLIDINPADLETVRQILREKVPELEVRAFGSRVSWTARDTSDLDLVLMTEEPLDIPLMAKLKDSFSESNLPFRIDIVDWASTSENFRRVIARKYTVIWRKQNLHNEWPTMELGNCIVINDSTRSPEKTWTFINYLDTGNIKENEISKIQRLIVGKDKIPSRARRQVQLGDIVYSTVRPNQKHFGLLKEIPENFLVSTGFSVMRGKRNIANTNFIYWFLTQKHIVEQLQVIAEQNTSAYPSIRPADIESLKLNLPPISKQCAIANVLDTLDNKVRLNHRINQTLESTAQALFKSWFVDFDPVRAKMEGHRPRSESLSGLPTYLYNFFPDRLVDSEIGQIPDGWEIKTLKDLCHKPQYGYTDSAKSESVGPKFIRITDINKKSWIDWKTVPHCKITEKDFNKYRLRKGDIIIARIADPGHGVMIEEDREAVFASYLIRFRPIDRLHARILQYWLRSDKYWELVFERSTGTTRANLNAKAMSGFPLVVPSLPVSEAFNEYVNSMRTRVTANALESHSLKTVRDTLLPELMSGKLDVKRTKQKGLRT